MLRARVEHHHSSVPWPHIPETRADAGAGFMRDTQQLTGLDSFLQHQHYPDLETTIHILT